MSPTPRTAIILAVLALAALVVPVALVALAAVALLGAVVADARAVRGRPAVRRALPAILSRGVPAPLHVHTDDPGRARLRVRQPALPDLGVSPAEGQGGLEAELQPHRRGRHRLPGLAGRLEGPLGLSAHYLRWDEEAEVLIYPDLPAARRIALAVRQGRHRDPGLIGRGPLGLGTEFESIRDYLPDDDVRQINWSATQRMGRPMSNQYRVEQDRDVVCVVDCGRLMSAPLGDRTRLDEALDAATAVAIVADQAGDRCGALAFDAEVRRDLRPRRNGARAVVNALFDLEPVSVESDYELAFRTVGGSKRALVMVLTDVLDEAAARSLLGAVPVLARRHAVVVATVSDPDVEAAVRTPPAGMRDLHAATAALDLLAARARVAARLQRAGAQVVERPPKGLAAGCVQAYLAAKARARL